MRLSQVRALITELFNNSAGDDAVGGLHEPAAQPLLYAYIEAELDGKDAAALYPHIDRTLQSDSELMQHYLDLKVVLQADRQNALIEPPRPAHFDFSYLKTAAEQTEPVSKPWHLDQWGRVIIEFTQELVQSLQPPAPQLAPVKSAADRTGAPVRYVIAGDDGEDVHVEIAVRSARNDPLQCNIAVTVDIPSRGGWPHLNGSEVALKRGDALLAKRTTDAFGKVLFLDIAKADLPQLVFQITPVR